jgi:hypothetical protein
VFTPGRLQALFKERRERLEVFRERAKALESAANVLEKEMVIASGKVCMPVALWNRARSGTMMSIGDGRHPRMPGILSILRRPSPDPRKQVSFEVFRRSFL